jgi:hypothetical protein
VDQPEVPDVVRQQQERCVFGMLHAAATLLVDEFFFDRYFDLFFLKMNKSSAR